jgi:hypothetical protein
VNRGWFFVERRKSLLFLRRSCGRLCRGCWLGLHRLGFDALQNRSWAGAARGINRQRNRSDQKCDSRPGGCTGKCAGSAAGTECGLAALSAERGRNVATGAALQQYNDDNKETNKNMDDGNQCNHELNSYFRGQTSRTFRLPNCPMTLQKSMVRKGGFEPPRLSAPPPQDGVSASSTTSAQV